MRGIAVLAALMACQRPPPKQEEPPPPRPPRAIFSYGRPFIARQEPPARFSAPLPTRVSELAFADRYPPDAIIVAGLERADPDVQARVVEAVRAAARGGRVPKALAELHHRWFGDRPTPAVCDFIGTQLDRGPRAARDVFWRALVRCPGEQYAPLFERADAPDFAVVDWYAGAEQPLPYSPRLGEAAARVARRGVRVEVRRVGEALANVRGEAAVRAVRKLQRRVRDPERRALIGVGLLERTEEGALSLARRACRHSVVRFEPGCDRRLGRGFDLNGDARALGVDAEWLLDAYGEDETLGALSRCVVDGGWDDERLRCLRRLARIDWTRAVAAATSVAESLAASSPMQPVVRTLVRFPERGQIEAGLREAGLVDGPSRGSGLDAAELLVAHGRALRVEAYQDPSYVGVAEAGRTTLDGHDLLLHDLAALVRPDLDGIAFRQVAVALRAWDGDWLFEAKLRSLGDWYDVPAVVGLANTFLRARQSSKRLLLLDDGYRVVTVLGGPADAIRAAVEAELIRPRRR